MIKLSKIKENPDNPRGIEPEKLHKLIESIKAFPKMMSLRPIVADKETGFILGGNMRFRALQQLGYEEVEDDWIKWAEDLSEEEKAEFLVKDNVGFGEWDFEALETLWGTEQVEDWGLDMPEFEADVDKSLLDVDIPQVHKMTKGVKKAIQIPFDKEDYDEAVALVKQAKEKEIYVGKMLMDVLKKAMA